MTLPPPPDRTRPARPARPQIGGHPTYPHDCTACVFLGRYAYSGRTFDLYACPGHGAALTFPTLLARGSKLESDYQSGFALARYHATASATGRAADAVGPSGHPNRAHPLAEAYRRAQAQDVLLPEETYPT